MKNSQQMKASAVVLLLALNWVPFTRAETDPAEPSKKKELATEADAKSAEEATPAPKENAPMVLAPEWKIGVGNKFFKNDPAYNKKLEELIGLIQRMADRSDANISTAIDSGDEAKFKLLLSQGFNINATSGKDGTTLLMDAVEHDQLRIVQFLIGSGANVNIKTKDGRTALSLAKKKADKEMIESLTKAGAKE